MWKPKKMFDAVCTWIERKITTSLKAFIIYTGNAHRKLSLFAHWYSKRKRKYWMMSSYVGMVYLTNWTVIIDVVDQKLIKSSKMSSVTDLLHTDNFYVLYIHSKEQIETARKQLEQLRLGTYFSIFICSFQVSHERRQNYNSNIEIERLEC